MSCGANPQLNYIYKLITHDICKNSVALIFFFFLMKVILLLSKDALNLK